MQYQPYDYQKYAIDFIIDHPVAALFLDCGLGKTSITLSAIRYLKYELHEVSRVLVIAPIRVAAVSWPDELRRWDHLRDLTCSVAVGSEQQRRAAMEQDADVYIINRENIAWLAEDCWKHPRFDMLVIDELSSFKNPKSKRFRSLMKLRPEAGRVVGLTGTPTGNGLLDLFAEFRVLDLGQRLGKSYKLYRAAYFMSDPVKGRSKSAYRPRPGAREKIYDQIRDITISMQAAEHLKMPQLVRSLCVVHMSMKEQEHYVVLKRKMEQELTAKLKARIRKSNASENPETSEGSKEAENSELMNAPNTPDATKMPKKPKKLEETDVTMIAAKVMSGKLLQMANGAVYDEEHQITELHDRKLDALEDILEAAGGKPVLVAYAFQHDLERICRRLEGLGIDFLRIRDEESIRRWNAGEVPVGLIHPASAGHGLNLQAGGSHLVWFGLTWSLELYQQTNARLFRQGQQAGTVVIQHIVTAGTMDERVLQALDRKNCTQEALLEAVRAEIGVEPDPPAPDTRTDNVPASQSAADTAPDTTPEHPDAAG